MNTRISSILVASTITAALIAIAACGSMPKFASGGGVWGNSATQGAQASQGGSGVAIPNANAQAMSSAEFQALKTRVSDEGMTSNKIAAVEEASTSAWFSASQVGELTTMIDMKGDRVRLVEAVADRILDLENTGAVTSQLTFADERSSVESAMNDALAARRAEESRIAKEERIAEEQRLAEEERAAAERRAAQNQAAQDQTSTPSSSSQSSAESSAYCCLGEKYNTCESGTGVAACMGWGQCFFKCTMNNQSDCTATCTDKYPAIKQCRADASKDHLCRK